MPPIKNILIGEYCNYLIANDGTVWNYDDKVLKNFPLPEKVQLDKGSAGHPYGYVIGVSGALYMLTGDSVRWVKIADGVKLVAGYWDFAVIIHSDDVISIYQNGKLYTTLATRITDTRQVSSAHYILFRDGAGAVWQLNWSHTPWRSGTVWQRTSQVIRDLKPTKIALPGPATDITTARTMHSTAIVNGEPYTWCDSFGAKYVGLKAGTNQPVRMTDLWRLPEKIVKIRSTDNTIHAIGESGRAYARGNAAGGQVGNGQVHPDVLATGKWDWGKYLWQQEMVEVGRPGEIYVDIFTGTSYPHRTGMITDKGIIRFAGYNKFGLAANGIFPEQPSDPNKVLAGLSLVTTFRRAVFPLVLTVVSQDQIKAMLAAGTYPPRDPRVLIKTVKHYDDGSEEVEMA